MRAKELIVGIVLTLAVVVTASRADDGPEAEIAKLRAKVKALQDENQKLQAEVDRLKEKAPKAKVDVAKQNEDFRRLSDLVSELVAKPNDETLKKEAAALAIRMSPDMSGGYGQVWDALLRTGTLKDGTSLAEATKLLGQPTTKAGTQLTWYYNPMGRHVAPVMYATETKDGLVGWKLMVR